ncbi:MAG: membrane protein insertase YidC [Gemmatimonadales bacterium]
MDRRLLWAIALMMLIAIAPSLLFKSQPGRGPSGAPSRVTPGQTDSLKRSAPPAVAGAPVSGAPPSTPGGSAAPPSEDTVEVSSDLYSYRFSTRGGRLIGATMRQYQSLAIGEAGHPAELLTPGHALSGLTLVAGADSLPITDWAFTPSARQLTVPSSPKGGVAQPAALRLTADRGPTKVELTYTFLPDQYSIGVSGRIQGIGPNGGMLLLGLGSGIRNTEHDSVDNDRALGLVTKDRESHVTLFGGLKPGELTTLSGPFEWVAVKSKYFVVAALTLDTTVARISGVTATALPTGERHRSAAAVHLSLPVGPDGGFRYELYTGPMEFHRLARIGHDFDDVNPYGWPGFRTVIRFFAAPVRWLLVTLHTRLHLAYGVVLILFGVMVRLILWPLNQKAMRASMQMQVVQPLLKEIQERYKNDPQKLNQEMFKLYREHKVNPLGGCWPMLLPFPVLLALFVVFQYSIELRGTPFLWLPDLSRADPLYILPVVMGLSMFALSKVGQLGMEPNPQMKMMLYVMPVMMTVLFLNFACGLNLYYAVSNLVSIPQQWFLAKERLKRIPPPAPPPAPKPAPKPSKK